MSMTMFAIAAGLTLFCVMAAQRMARSRGKNTVNWMLAAALLGPLPLLPLALLRKG